MKLKKHTDPELLRSGSVYGSLPAGRPPLWQRLPKWLRRSLVLLVLIGLGVFGTYASKMGYGWFRGKRLDSNLEQAQVAARMKDWPLARDLSRTVLLARPTDLEAFRIWNRALSRMEEPRAYMAAVQLFTDTRATRADQLECFRVLVLQAPQAVALGAFNAFDPDFQKSPEVRGVIADLLLWRGEVDLVESMIRELPEGESIPSTDLALLRALCARPSLERVREAREIFASLVASGASAEALEALSVLGETDGGLAPGPPLPLLPEWVNTQSDATDLQHLMALHPGLEGASTESRKLIFDHAVKRFIAIAPGILGTWLVRHGQAPLAAQILEMPSESRPDAYISRLHALLKMGLIEDVDKLLASPPESTDRMELEMIQVAIARSRNNASQEASAWSRALYEALLDTSSNRFLEIVRYAELLDVPWAAERALVAAVRVGWGRLPLYQDLLPVFASLAIQNRTNDLLTMYRSLLRYEPKNVELLNNFYYLALLQGILPPAEVMTRMEKLASEHPELPELLSAAGMAALMAGQPDRTLEWLPRLAASERLSPAMMTAMKGTALLLTDRPDEARELLKMVPWKSFLREENQAFRKLILPAQLPELPLPEVTEPEISDGIEETPAWKKAMERLEQERVNDVLPALPVPRIPTNEMRDSG
jgi:tetratricopeptide (TPR) repeat protein